MAVPNINKKVVSRVIFTILILTVFIYVVATSYSYWDANMKPDMLWARSRNHDMRKIFYAVALYNGKYDRLPKNLKEIVSAGYLPEKSKIYYCPLIHNSFFSKELLYSQCEYVITFDPNLVVISVPKEIFDKEPYKSINEKSRKVYKITSGDRAYETGKDYLGHKQKEYKRINDSNADKRPTSETN